MFVFLLYNLLALLLLPFAMPFLLFVVLTKKKYKTAVLSRLGFISKDIKNIKSAKTVLWFHAVSVGEVAAALPLISECRKAHPDAFLLVSTVTVTGNKSAMEKCRDADCVIYFPFDFVWTVHKVLNLVRPAIFVFFEKEIWPNFLMLCRRKGIPAILVNGKLSQRSFLRYRRFGFVWREVFDCVSCFCLQSKKDFDMFEALGVPEERLSITGNMKYEQALQNPGRPPDFLELFNDAGKQIFIAGSTHDGEEKIILDAYCRLKEKELVLIIAPRHLERVPKIEALVESYGLGVLTRKKLDTATDIASLDVIILDTIGELNGIYKKAVLVFIGGSLVPIGGHNILEAAVWGRMVMFGPYMDNTADIAEEFLSAKAAIQVNDADDIVRNVSMLLDDRKCLSAMGDTARRLVEKNQGALQKTASVVNRFLSEKRQA